MADASVPVDLFNPGQVFACLGLMEAADVLIGGAQATFDWSTPQAVFRLRAAGETDPIKEVLSFLAGAEVVSLAPQGSANSTEKWAVPTERIADGAPFPIADPSSPATLPAILRDPHPSAGTAPRALMIDVWGDATDRDNAKFWAGSAGYPGVGLVRDALDAVRATMAHASANPFDVSVPMSSGFRFDPRASYVPLNLGYSLNAFSNHAMRGYPLVEVLAAIGLTHARPERGETKLDYRYGVISGGDTWLAPAFHRAALGAPALPFPRRTFRMRLDWPGQEGQARCITTVSEEYVP
jgi:CRISPR-associated protein Csb3